MVVLAVLVWGWLVASRLLCFGLEDEGDAESRLRVRALECQRMNHWSLVVQVCRQERMHGG